MVPASHTGGWLSREPLKEAPPGLPEHSQAATGDSSKSTPQALLSALAGSAQRQQCPEAPVLGTGGGGCFCSTWAQAPSLSQVHSSPGEVVLVKAERGLMYRGPSIHPKPWVYSPPPARPAAEWIPGSSSPKARSGAHTAPLSWRAISLASLPSKQRLSDTPRWCLQLLNPTSTRTHAQRTGVLAGALGPREPQGRGLLSFRPRDLCSPSGLA